MRLYYTAESMYILKYMKHYRAYEGVYDGCSICRGVVAAEEIVLPAESKRPDGILDEVVVDVDPAVIHIARQTGKKTVGIGKGLSEPALGQDLRIGLLNPLFGTVSIFRNFYKYIIP